MNSAPPYVTSEEVDRASHIEALARRMRSVYATGLRGVEVPQRTTILRESPFSAFDTMPALSDDDALFIAKVGAVVPQSNPVLSSANAVVVAFSARTGRSLAILDGSATTSLKCAAVTALVTDICAVPEARVLGLIGTGAQARAQIRGVGAVRQLQVLVASHATSFEPAPPSV